VRMLEDLLMVNALKIVNILVKQQFFITYMSFLL